MTMLTLLQANRKIPFDPSENPEKDPNPADQTPDNEHDPKKYC